MNTMFKELYQTQSFQNQLDPEISKVRELAIIYEELLGIYLSKPTIKVFGAIRKDYRFYKTLVRCVVFSEELGCSYEDYLKAQFWYYNKLYNRAPRVPELAHYKNKLTSRKIAEVYLFRLAKKTNNIVGKSIEAKKPDRDSRFNYFNNILKQFMIKLNKSEEEILKTYASDDKIGLFFDKDWLMSNKTYLKLKAQGTV